MLPACTQVTGSHRVEGTEREETALTDSESSSSSSRQGSRGIAQRLPCGTKDHFMGSQHRIYFNNNAQALFAFLPY